MTNTHSCHSSSHRLLLQQPVDKGLKFFVGALERLGVGFALLVRFLLDVLADPFGLEPLPDASQVGSLLIRIRCLGLDPSGGDRVTLTALLAFEDFLAFATPYPPCSWRWYPKRPQRERWLRRV